LIKGIIEESFRLWSAGSYLLTDHFKKII